MTVPLSPRHSNADQCPAGGAGGSSATASTTPMLHSARCPGRGFVATAGHSPRVKLFYQSGWRVLDGVYRRGSPRTVRGQSGSRPCPGRPGRSGELIAISPMRCARALADRGCSRSSTRRSHQLEGGARMGAADTHMYEDWLSVFNVNLLLRSRRFRACCCLSSRRPTARSSTSPPSPWFARPSVSPAWPMRAVRRPRYRP